MCPICLSTLGWIAVGGGTGSGLLAALIVAVRGHKEKEEDDERSTDHDA
jgi:hypothetical protein